MRKRILITAILILALVGATEFLARTLGEIPDISRLETFTPSLSTRLLDTRGELIAEFYTERRAWARLSEIPVDLQNAVISTEDSRFFRHWGMDFQGIARAALANLKEGVIVEGGSTITQQLAKVLFLTREKTLIRKMREIILSLQIERNYTKEEILELYLNQIYFGHGAYGVDSAARFYFGKSLKELGLSECAMLAGLPRAPSRYSPFKHPTAALRRRNTVLSLMKEGNFIPSQEEAQGAMRESLPKSPLPFQATHGAYFAEWIRQELEPKLGESVFYRGGLEIHTTLDLKQQKAAEAIMEKHLFAFDAAKGSTEPVQGAMLAMEPRTGEIRVMVGGRNFKESQFNRALQARRQPGSAFKVFTYAAALEKGFHATSVIEDAPIHFYNDGTDWRLLSATTDFSDVADPLFLEELQKKNAEAKKPEEKVLWSPRNYSKVFHGPVLLRTALEQSLNVCAIRVLESIRPAAGVEMARRLGIQSPLEPVLSLALGSYGVSLQEMVSAFSVFASRGIRAAPYGVKKVLDSRGNILEENGPKQTVALSPQTAFLMTTLLRGVVERGTGRGAMRLGRPAAGKTGTTQDFGDAWFVGYTPQLVVGVWVGYDILKSLGEKMTGGRLCAPLWADFMKEALAGKPAVDFQSPQDILFMKIDRRTGLLALGNPPGAYLEAYLKGTEPRAYMTEVSTPSIMDVQEDTEQGF